MIVHDLYVINEKGNCDPTKRGIPVKLIYYTNKGVVLDTKTLEEYSSEIIYHDFQKNLSMPLDTSPGLNLPDKRTGANQRSPYILFHGEYKFSKKEKGAIIKLYIVGKKVEKKKAILSANFDIKTKAREFSGTDKDGIPVRIDKTSYKSEGKLLYVLYEQAGIIKNGIFASKVFSDVCSEFFDFVSSRNLDATMESSVRFQLYILPTESPIEYVQPSQPSSSGDETENIGSSNIDSFGNEWNSTSSKTTQTASFFSYDDPAFTLNQRRGSDFYKQLYISETSHQKIEIPQSRLVTIGGFKWLFIDIEYPSEKFDFTSGGIYKQLYKNYERMDRRGGDPYARRAGMKVFCFKFNQKKCEIILDENLTLPFLKKLFAKISSEDDIPNGALEILIQRFGKNVIYTDYLSAVRSLLEGLRLNRNELVAKLVRHVHDKLPVWLETRNTEGFFRASDFCINVLTRDEHSTSMSPEELYAYGVGKCAAAFIKFKEEAGEQSNSLRDILTYSRYDRERLRFVVAQIGRGINLSRSDSYDINSILKEISSYISGSEISDDFATQDYSYFFYKGVFEKIGERK